MPSYRNQSKSVDWFPYDDNLAFNELNSLYSCSINAEIITHYFLHCHFKNLNRVTLMNDLENITISFSTVSDDNLIGLLSYGDDKFDDTKNKKNYYKNH